MVVNLHNSDTMAHESTTMRKIEHGIEILFKNDTYTTPVTFEFALEKKSNQINVFESHRKIFTAMKMIDNTTKIITKQRKIFEHSDSFLEGQDYLEHFPFHNKVQKQRKIFVCC